MDLQLPPPPFPGDPRAMAAAEYLRAADDLANAKLQEREALAVLESAGTFFVSVRFGVAAEIPATEEVRAAVKQYFRGLTAVQEGRLAEAVSAMRAP